ncbi:uncharacterized protein LOC115363898 [Myripristis murdjan]|uniref:Uncharacterized LOC115363898 n=1 Tax=Myripristis murdjan TaxID=586833 RepID=A0A667WQ61_9TELE|nr:uncharacterized protein LOC115363898 [Myripristis murdjan]
MHLKQKVYCYGVLLIYTITTITLISVGWCEPAVNSSQPNSTSNAADLHNDSKGRVALTTKPLIHPSHRTARRRHHLELKQDVARKAQNLQNQDSSDGSQPKSFGGRPNPHRFTPRMKPSSDKSFTTRGRDKPQEEEGAHPSFKLRNEFCSEGEIKNVISGKFYIAGQLAASASSGGYQSDSAVSGQSQGGQVRVKGQPGHSPEESWQRLEPEVECGDDAMTLTVRRRRAAQLLLDRVNTSSLPLSQLPSECGYSVKTTWRDLRLVAPYDACHVTQEGGSYMLPLLWGGTPVKMSCPVSQFQPQTLGLSSLCCSPYGLTVSLQGQSASEELKVKVRGEWTPLVLLAEQCGYTLQKQAGELLIAAPFITCGITVKNEKYTLSLQIGKKVVTLACPVSPLEELPQTHQSVVSGSHHPTRGRGEAIPETVQPFPWAPPFYLAPLDYPHPTFPQRYPSPGAHDAYNPSPPPSLPPSPTTRRQPLPSVGSSFDSQRVYQDYQSYQILPPSESYEGLSVHSPSLPSMDKMEESYTSYPDLRQKQTSSISSHLVSRIASRSPSSATDFPAQTKSPSQPPSHAFNPFYHYYHHPKIPLPDPSQDPDPGPKVVTSESYPAEQPDPASRKPGFPDFQPYYIHQPKVSGNANLAQATSHPSTLPVTSPELHHRDPAPHVPYNPQPYPYHYFYHLPQIFAEEAKRLSLHDHTTATTTSLPSGPQTMEPGTSAHPLPGLPQLPFHYRYSFHPYPGQPNPNHPGLQDLPKHMYKDTFGPSAPDGPGKPQLQPNVLLTKDENVKTLVEDKKLSAPVVHGAQPPLPLNFGSFHYLSQKPQSNQQHEPNPITLPPPKQPSSPTPSAIYNRPLYPHYYHPYYYMYYGLERLPSTDDDASSSRKALEPSLQASASPTVESPQHPAYFSHPTPIPSHRPQTTTSPTESLYNLQNGPFHPYYNYYQYYFQPAASIDNQEPPSAGSMQSEKGSKSESRLSSESTYIRTDSFEHAAEEAYPSMPQLHHNPVQMPSSHHISQQHPYDQVQLTNGEEAEERPDNEMRDHLQAISHTPSASPCGLGPVSNVDCSSLLSCCSYPVNECTAGQHFVFAVPDSVVEPTVGPPALLSEVSNVSCTPQRLTSNPDLYTVPLEGCGVHTHMAGQTVVHLLDIHGSQPLQQEHSSMQEGFPVRLLVECKTSPGSPGKVKLQVMDPSPSPPVQSTPATVTVQLRIATDESFTSYHPEAHLPLSLVKGRPVYLEVGLLNHPEPDLVLLVHYCLVYTYTPYASWMLIYDGCPKHGDSQLLLPPPPSPSHPHHIRRLAITSFLSLPTQSPSRQSHGGYSHLEDPEMYFMCSTEVCSAADGDCTVGCISSPQE